MTPRASWKGALRVGEVICPVALFTAASTSERIAFHMVDRRTGHRLHRQFVDSQTGEPVAPADQVKGYETAQRDYVTVEPEEIAAAIPDSDKTLAIEAFIPCDELDDLYFGRPYYIAPSGAAADQAFAVLREGMRAKKVAAIARTVLFRRLRTLLVRPHESGLVATALSFDYEIRSASDAFGETTKVKLEPEMMELAKHIIATKKGAFDPRSFDDRYEAALAEVVRAKIEGRPVAARAPAAPTEVVDLMQALRKSAAAGGSPATGKGSKPAAKPAAVARRPARTARTAAPSKKRKAS